MEEARTLSSTGHPLFSHQFDRGLGQEDPSGDIVAQNRNAGIIEPCYLLDILNGPGPG